MKRYRLMIGSGLLLLVVLFAAQAALAQGGGFDLSWHALFSGGPAAGSAGPGDYSLTSAIGQPVAGTVSGIAGSGYSLCSGYLCGGSSSSRVYLPLVRK